jgi:hypothetical protein
MYVIGTNGTNILQCTYIFAIRLIFEIMQTVNIQGVSEGIVNILGGGSMDYSE